jgi:hypothetical protein
MPGRSEFHFPLQVELQLWSGDRLGFLRDIETHIRFRWPPAPEPAFSISSWLPPLLCQKARNNQYTYISVCPYQITSFDTALFCATGDRRIKQIDCPCVTPFDTARELQKGSGKDAVKLQAAAPARLAKLLDGVSPARARKRPAPDNWSIAEIVVHMADTEVVFGYLIRGIVGEPGTRIDGFDQDAWLAALHYDKRDMKKSFAEYRAFREATSGCSGR